MNFKEYFSYDPDTGHFYVIKERHGSDSKVGDRAEAKGRYLRICFNGRAYQAHRVAFYMMTGRWPGPYIDHVNRNKHDNSWDNLKECTNKDNMRNTPSRYQHGLKGLKKVKNRWRVQRTIDGKSILFLSTPCLGQALKKQREVYEDQSL